MAPPLLSLRDAVVTFGGAPLFSGITGSLARGDRTCLVGRNGSGKSTLLKVLAGLMELDGGDRVAQAGVRVAYLPQTPQFEAGGTVGEHVASGLPADAHDEPHMHRVEAILDGLKLDAGRALVGLSGGEGRRATLARALVGEPDVLLLDEPTNHLDLPTIEWLEEELRSFSGALLVISHDRAFLNRLTRSCWWLDRGRLREIDSGFKDFDRRCEEMMAAEEAEMARMDKRLLAEAHWLHRGVTGRRRRNQGRLRALMSLRKERAEWLSPQGRAKLAADRGEMSGRLVCEVEDIAKSYGDRMVLKPFSTRILRGDRVGILGPNGAGKTTLLRILAGEMAPDQGTVRLGTNLQPAYFDQHRAILDDEATLWDTLTGGGNDQVMVRGRPRHVVGYLKEFLFAENQAFSPVKALSGGERNRLLLAKLLAVPSNLLILDEPTNDLDMDTLDLLEEVLCDYEGTLLVVSHDRDFLDRLVTSVIALEGDGSAEECAGGYSDYLNWRKQGEPAAAKPASATAKAAPAERPKAAATKLGYKDQRELESLPVRIEALGTEIAALEGKLADSGLYARDRALFEATNARLDTVRTELAATEERWLELEMRREDLAGAKGS